MVLIWVHCINLDTIEKLWCQMRGNITYTPWFNDDNLYPVCDRIIDDIPEIKYYIRRNFPSFARCSKFNTWFLNRNFTKWRCFITDVQCFLSINYNGFPSNVLPWVLTVEHLVPLKYREFNSNPLITHGFKNQDVCGKAINKQIGHIPLALKLLHKKTLKNIDYEREHPTYNTYLEITDYIIKTELQFKYLGRYPWHPWLYEGNESIIPNAFIKEMIKFDNEFLTIPNLRERNAFIDDFTWRW